MMPCEKAEDIKEIKSDVKEIKVLLRENLIKQAIIDKDITLHKNLWRGFVVTILGMATYFIQKNI